jgi:hypothetical protein
VQHPDDVHRYLTEQIVGPPFSVDMGPADSVQVQAAGRPVLLWLEQRFSLAGVAARSLLGNPATAAAGRPLNLAGLRRWRLGLAAALLLGWSAALVGGTVWWLQH